MSSSDQSSATQRGGVQVVVTAFLALFCIVGMALWGLPYYYDFMMREFGWTRAQVTSGNALSKLIVGPIFAFIAGWMIDRFGPRRLMMAGILMAGIALIGLGSISNLGMFYIFYFFNALGYIFGGPLPNQVLLSQWFDKSRGKAMGIAYLGIGLGGAVVPLMSYALVQHFGWHNALRALGCAIIVISFPMAFFLKEQPPRGSRALAEVATPRSNSAFKTASFYLLTLGSMCSIAAVSGTQQNLKLFLSVDQHYAQNEAARIISLVLTFSIAGRLLMGWLADHFPKKYVMILIYTLVAAGIALLFLSPTRMTMYLFAAVFGIGLGGDYMIVPLVAADIFGLKVLGRLMAFVLMANGVAEAAAPWFIGHMRDVTGNYSSGFMALIGIALLGAAAALPLPRKAATISPNVAAASPSS
ncbi:MAG TPA: MFS transporter [Terriglobales bacterium]|nr:MFS transporter [Terriglobales bacterium]